jgi:hypothetical protein
MQNLIYTLSLLHNAQMRHMQGFLSKFEGKINQLRFAVAVGLIAKSLGSADEAQAFYESIQAKKERLGPEASLYLDTEVILLKLKKVGGGGAVRERGAGTALVGTSLHLLLDIHVQRLLVCYTGGCCGPGGRAQGCKVGESPSPRCSVRPEVPTRSKLRAKRLRSSTTVCVCAEERCHPWCVCGPGAGGVDVGRDDRALVLLQGGHGVPQGAAASRYNERYSTHVTSTST